MQKFTGKLAAFLAGIAVMGILFFIFNKKSLAKTSSKSDYYILTNQISKMNKMVVMEQDFTSLQKTKLSYEILGSKVSENELITLTKTNAQVSYDLNKMKIDVDTINKKVVIAELPRANLRITPSVEIKSMDDSFLNRINEDQIKKITQDAKISAEKNVNREYLISEGKNQLHKNLEQIFVLAKTLNYKIEDKTQTFSPEKL